MELSPSETRRRHQQFRRLFAAALGASAVCGLVLISSASSDQADHKVTLCHATDSAKSPYASVTVDYHSVLGEGHGSHDGPVFDPFTQGKWGDIAAAFLIPAGIIFGVLLGLVIVKHTFLLTGRGVRYARARHRSRPSRPAGRGPAAPEPPLERRTRTHTGPRAPG